MSSKDVLKLIKDKQVEYVDLRFTDPKGKLQHLTMDSTVVDEDIDHKNSCKNKDCIAKQLCQQLNKTNAKIVSLGRECLDQNSIIIIEEHAKTHTNFCVDSQTSSNDQMHQTLLDNTNPDSQTYHKRFEVRTLLNLAISPEVLEREFWPELLFPFAPKHSKNAEKSSASISAAPVVFKMAS